MSQTGSVPTSTHVVYACNKALNFDINWYHLFGYRTLFCHPEDKSQENGISKKCTKIYFPTKDSEMSYRRIRRDAMIQYREETGEDMSWGCTFRVELIACKQKNTYTAVKCSVHKGRFCGAK